MALRALADKPAPHVMKGPRCTVCMALDSLPAEDASVLRGWMSDPGWTYVQIADETHADPDTPTLAIAAIRRHATGQCARREYLRGSERR